MTRHPSAKAITLEQLSSRYGASNFQDCLKRFVAKCNHPTASATDVRRIAATVPLWHISKVAVWHKAKFWEADYALYRHASDEYDVLHATPARRDKRGKLIAGRFDVALVNTGTGGTIGVEGITLNLE